MGKVIESIKKFSPWSYLILSAIALELISMLMRLIIGRVSSIFTAITIYQSLVFFFLFLWIIVLGIATLLKRQIRSKEFIFSLIPLVFLIFLGEVVCRIAGSACATYVPTKEVQTLYLPEHINSIKERRERNGQLNSAGFRGREFDFKKGKDDFVIVVLGGSTATGAYASLYQNVPSVYLEEHLKDYILKNYSKNLKVFSLAEPAADAEDEAFWLFKLGVYLKPDVVLSITGFNNMNHSMVHSGYWDFSSGARGFRRPGIKIVQNLGVGRIGQTMMAFLDNKLDKYSALYRFIVCKAALKEKDPLKSDIRFSGYKVNESENHLAGMRFVETLRNLNTFCLSKGIRFYAVLQPFPTCGKKRLTKGKDENIEQYIYSIMVDEIAKQNGNFVPYWDATAALSDELDSMNLFSDSCHLKDPGFVVLNDSIIEFLKTKF